MAGNVIFSARFEGDAYSPGSFDPPDQTFSVAGEVSFAIVRIRIEALHPGTAHETRIYVNKANGGYVNYGQLDAYEGEDTTGSMAQVARLTAGITYQLGIYFFGFQPGEHVVVKLDLLELTTNLAEVTRDVLMRAEADLAVNAITFGFSDATIATIMNSLFTSPEFAIGPTPHLTLCLYVYSSNSHPPVPGFPMKPQVAIDADTSEVVVTGTLALGVYVRAGNPSEMVATAYAAVEVRCEPAMVTTTADALQLKVNSARILPSMVTITILSEGEILQGYPSVDAFRSDIEGIINSIVQQQGSFDGLLPAYIASRPMPDYWNRAVNMELTFKRFDYRWVQTHGVDVGYLFAVFSVRSLMLPIPCYCEQESALQSDEILLPIAADRLSFPPSTDPVRAGTRFRRYKHCSSLAKVYPNVDQVQREEDVWPPPAYQPIFAAAELMSFGVSQRAFREIARPYANQGDDQSFSTGGAVYASARFWYRSTLEDANITADGVSAVIDFTTEGSAKAAVRDRCGHDVASASVRLRIRIDDTSMRWVVGIEQEHKKPYTLTITGQPSVSIGDITVDLDHPGDLEPPLDQVDDWILTTICSALTPSLNRIAESFATIRFIRTENGVNGDLRLAFAEVYYLAGQALVLAARLEAFVG